MLGQRWLQVSSWAVALGFLVACTSCSCGDSPKPAEGMAISSASDLEPATLPGDSAEVVLDGSPVEVDLQAKRSGERFEIHLTKHAEPFDVEVYSASAGAFSLVKAAGEEYIPPLPLLKFPMKIGELWKWSGTLVAGSERVSAKAEIDTFQKSTAICEIPIEAVLVQVALTIETPQPIQRDLQFFFAKGKGPFQREFGTSIRRPLCK